MLTIRTVRGAERNYKELLGREKGVDVIHFLACNPCIPRSLDLPSFHL